MGIRGLDLSDLFVSGASYKRLGSEEMMRSTFQKLDREIAAIFLGLSDGTISKAIEYSKVRTAFDHPLKDYSPIFDDLVSLKMEIDVLRFYLYGSGDEYSRALIKIKAKDLSLRATRVSLQTHGGYGYIHDFGIEKYYRDAMALSVYFGQDKYENMVLSDHIFGEAGGII
ncbi:TVG1372758 [Thermoplasma volcanium GSS1]|uniref:TVG1372758 protein n=1 Tax=Thermoplasma volcanium (strain ATCC 51530 / DSM 4299 / JCM 9571 / NBRC 15438 / GSS1) TaxID=273116 RepID=Q978T5_THEVO|nr:acyl-CoA dehydrogenase family protein [Thermoplasma volcanium]BAB60472.1 TVG1372758 [Thermoplasma volcanium GSS1]